MPKPKPIRLTVSRLSVLLWLNQESLFSLARAVNTSPSTLHRLARGVVKKPSPALLRSLAEFFNCSTAEIVGEVEGVKLFDALRPVIRAEG